VHIAAGELAMCGAATSGARFGDSVDPEGPPVRSVEVEGHEIPAPAERHQFHRFDVPRGCPTLPVGIAEPDAFSVGCRRGKRGQRLRVDHAVKRRGGDRRGSHRLGPMPKARRHHLEHLGERANGGLLQSCDRLTGREPQPDRKGDRFVVLQEQRRHCGASRQPITAIDAHRGLDGVPQAT
jgi:hypothetical protein